MASLQLIVEDLYSTEPKGMIGDGEHGKTCYRSLVGINKNSETPGKEQMLINDCYFDDKF